METADDLAKIKNAEAPERAARAKRYAEKNGSSAPATTGPMTKAEAVAITARIVTSAENFGELLLTAQRREAWKAMGYASWRAYAKAEFKFSQSRAYQLMDHAEILEVISPKGENSTMVEKPTERVTRPLAKLPPRHQQDAWEEAVRSSPGGKPTARQVGQVVRRRLSFDRLPTHAEKTGTKLTSLYHETARSVRQAWKKFNLVEQQALRKLVNEL